MSEQMSDKVWKQREVESGFRFGETAIEIYEDYETTISEGYAVVAVLAGANHCPTKRSASLIVAAPELLRVCQDVLRETTAEDGTPQEIMERMLDVVMRSQGI